MSAHCSVIQPTSNSKAAKGAPDNGFEGEYDRGDKEPEEKEDGNTPIKVRPADDGNEEDNVPVHKVFCNEYRVRSSRNVLSYSLMLVQSIFIFFRMARISEEIGGSAWFARTTTFATNVIWLEFMTSTKCLRLSIPKITSKSWPP